MKDPLNHIHETHCGVQEIVVDNKIDESTIKSVSSLMQGSCVVILHISDDGIVSEKSKFLFIFIFLHKICKYCKCDVVKGFALETINTKYLEHNWLHAYMDGLYSNDFVSH